MRHQGKHDCGTSITFDAEDDIKQMLVRCLMSLRAFGRADPSNMLIADRM